jgi:hypothetical protein
MNDKVLNQSGIKPNVKCGHWSGSRRHKGRIKKQTELYGNSKELNIKRASNYGN